MARNTHAKLGWAEQNRTFQGRRAAEAAASEARLAKAFAAHRRADPHCSCNDCIGWEIARAADLGNPATSD